MFTNKFDLVVSMGEDCACAMYLRKSSLRDASYPLIGCVMLRLKEE